MPRNNTNKNKNLKLSILLLKKIGEEDDNYKKRAVVKISNLLSTKQLLEIIDDRNEIDNIDLNISEDEINEEAEDTYDPSYISMRASTDDNSLRAMNELNIKCDYNYDSNFDDIKVTDLRNCSYEIYRQDARLSLTLIRKHLFLGAIVHKLRFYIEEGDETLSKVLEDCQEDTWILKVRYIMLFDFQALRISPTSVWSKSTLERCYHLYKLYHDNDLARIPYITRSVDFLMKNRKKFESYIFTDNELNEEGIFWQTAPDSIHVDVPNNNNNEPNNAMDES